MIARILRALWFGEDLRARSDAAGVQLPIDAMTIPYPELGLMTTRPAQWSVGSDWVGGVYPGVAPFGDP